MSAPDAQVAWTAPSTAAVAWTAPAVTVAAWINPNKNYLADENGDIFITETGEGIVIA